MYSWWIWGSLLILWFLTNTIIAGYMIRIFKDSANPPSFDKSVVLIKEGIIAEILIVIWAAPALIWTFFFSSPFILIALLFFLILMSPVSLFLFANTGEFWESLRIFRILSTIRIPGWKKYLAAWGIAIMSYLVVIAFNGILKLILNLVPVIPALLTSAIQYGFLGYSMVFFNIFVIRFFAIVLRNA